MNRGITRGVRRATSARFHSRSTSLTHSLTHTHILSLTQNKRTHIDQSKSRAARSARQTNKPRRRKEETERTRRHSKKRKRRSGGWQADRQPALPLSRVEGVQVAPLHSGTGNHHHTHRVRKLQDAPRVHESSSPTASRRRSGSLLNGSPRCLVNARSEEERNALPLRRLSLKEEDVLTATVVQRVRSVCLWRQVRERERERAMSRWRSGTNDPDDDDPPARDQEKAGGVSPRVPHLFPPRTRRGVYGKRHTRDRVSGIHGEKQRERERNRLVEGMRMAV